jgi:Recombinase
LERLSNVRQREDLARIAERLNFREACQHAGVFRQRLNQAIASGRLPAERGGGPGKPTYIKLEDLQAWCVSEGLAMPLEALERSERLRPEDLTAFVDRFHQMMERMERLVEQTIERLERSQAQAITPASPPIILERSADTPAQWKATAYDREVVIARILFAKDVEGKSYQQIADELNAEGIATFSGKGTWQKGNIGRFYKGEKD